MKSERKLHANRNGRSRMTLVRSPSVLQTKASSDQDADIQQEALSATGRDRRPRWVVLPTSRRSFICARSWQDQGRARRTESGCRLFCSRASNSRSRQATNAWRGSRPRIRGNRSHSHVQRCCSDHLLAAADAFNLWISTNVRHGHGVAASHEDNANRDRARARRRLAPNQRWR